MQVFGLRGFLIRVARTPLNGTCKHGESIPSLKVRKEYSMVVGAPSSVFEGGSWG